MGARGQLEGRLLAFLPPAMMSRKESASCRRR